MAYIACGVALLLLGIPLRNDTPSKVGVIVDLAIIGIAMCAIMTPVLTEVFVSVEDLEKQKPGRFGPFGAFAQAVRNSFSNVLGNLKDNANYRVVWIIQRVLRNWCVGRTDYL